ncbi:MAG TPA: choice-of-anchor Q domain-containing protein, partial [Anaerolineae bacterium]|nr:choice-of-anchor Q domain-containing protein [Anaerolineae bacterium]
GDYHLLPGSAAIDAGVFSGVAVDLDGQARPVGAGYDLGADEYVPPGVRYRAYVPAVVRRR